MTCTLTFLHRTLVSLDISAFKKKNNLRPAVSQPFFFYLRLRPNQGHLN